MFLLEIFINNLLPIFLCAGAGLALGRAFEPDIKTMTRLSFYIFSPCLVFASLTQSPVPGAEFAQIALFVLVFVGLMIALATAAGRLLELNRQSLVTLIIASAFVNSGNYGLAAVSFAFGDEALARAVVFYIASTFTIYTLGIVIASLGKQSLRGALREMVSVPAFYALIAAGLVHWLGAPIPLFLDRAVTLLGEAALPVMLIILGVQMARTRLELKHWPPGRRALVAAGVSLQLLVAPLAALALARPLGLTGLTWQAVVLEASMPTAVITTVLAVQYDLEVEPVTVVVVLSTLLSPLTLTPLIAFLQYAG